MFQDTQSNTIHLIHALQVCQQQPLLLHLKQNAEGNSNVTGWFIAN